MNNVRSMITSIFECKFVLRIGSIVKGYCWMFSVSLIHYATSLRAALARIPHTPSCGGFLYLLVESTGCGGNARGFEEGI